jgi:hypothetical protein
LKKSLKNPRIREMMMIDLGSKVKGTDSENLPFKKIAR